MWPRTIASGYLVGRPQFKDRPIRWRAVVHREVDGSKHVCCPVKEPSRKAKVLRKKVAVSRARAPGQERIPQTPESFEQALVPAGRVPSAAVAVQFVCNWLSKHRWKGGLLVVRLSAEPTSGERPVFHKPTNARDLPFGVSTYHVLRMVIPRRLAVGFAHESIVWFRRTLRKLVHGSPLPPPAQDSPPGGEPCGSKGSYRSSRAAVSAGRSACARRRRAPEWRSPTSIPPPLARPRASPTEILGKDRQMETKSRSALPLA